MNLELLAQDSSRAIKATDDAGGIEGLAVPFGDADRSDMRDIFEASTNYGRALKVGAEIRYHHGLPMVGNKLNPLADEVLGEAEFSLRDDGVWMKGRLSLDTPEKRALWTDVRAGKEQLSTGSANHLVRRIKNGDGTHTIKTWPIVEVSLTPSPAHPRTSVYPIKTLLELEAPSEAISEHEPGESPAVDGEPTEAAEPDPVPCDEPSPVSAKSLVDRSTRLVADLDELVPLWERAHKARIDEGRDLTPEKLAIADALAGHATRLHGIVAVAAKSRVDPETLAAMHREADELLAQL